AGIEQTIRAGAGRPDSDRVIAFLSPVAAEYPAVGTRRLAAPGPHAAVGSARRFLPFGLGRKPAARPFAIGPGLVPPHESHRDVVMDTPIRIGWKRTTRAGRKTFEATHSQGELVDE